MKLTRYVFARSLKSPKDLPQILNSQISSRPGPLLRWRFEPFYQIPEYSVDNDRELEQQYYDYHSEQRGIQRHGIHAANSLKSPTRARCIICYHPSSGLFAALDMNDAGGGIRTHELLRDEVLSLTPLTRLGDPRFGLDVDDASCKSFL
jgi:hypothetical protein